MAESVAVRETHSGKAAILSRGGWLPYLATALSLIVCYIKAITVAVLPMVEASWNFNPHIQAVLMWSFGLLAVIAIYRDRGKHDDRRPLYIAIAGLIIMIITLYTHYSVMILFLAYLLLLIGTFANQNAILKQLNARTQAQATELTELNRTLENRVNDQVAELDRIGQLKRFLSPEVADLIVEKGDNSLLESHRRYVAAVFCDLRAFTAFSERAEPEEVIDVLQEYHRVLGGLVSAHGGTIDHRAGDGLMVIFNDPLPCDEPVRRAIEMAFAMRDAVSVLLQDWAKYGHQLGFGIGVAAGYATLGIVGDATRSDYTAIGNVINLASRLCDQAQDGEILISQRAYLDLEHQVEGREVTGLKLDGLSRLQEVYSITALSSPAA